MKTPFTRMQLGFLLSVVLIGLSELSVFAQQEPLKVNVYKGRVVDATTSRAISHCSFVVELSNIAAVSNSEGEFLIKVFPDGNNEQYVSVSHLGYKTKRMSLTELKTSGNIILLEPVANQLPQLDVINGDASDLIREMYARVSENYADVAVPMTAFYRESIRKGKSYVSLSEMVADVQKQSYDSYKKDLARVYKLRKTTDYTKLDTMVFKLMGGPYNNLYLDVMKNPELIFTEDMFGQYSFTYDNLVWMDNEPLYVVNFKPKVLNADAIFEGRMFIDSKSTALKSIVFNLVLDNKELATSYFIKKKPLNAKVNPTGIQYQTDYVTIDDKWVFAYSRIDLSVKVQWKKKLFSSIFSGTMEMAMTNFQQKINPAEITHDNQLKSDVIISEAKEGFKDPEFWGSQNVIEPEKPIEKAIQKIINKL